MWEKIIGVGVEDVVEKKKLWHSFCGRWEVIGGFWCDLTSKHLHSGHCVESRLQDIRAEIRK